MITQEKLKHYLRYDNVTGDFVWRFPPGKKTKPGQIAGSDHGDGYTIIVLLGKHYRAHRLAWFYEYGYFPEHNIDHINRNRKDNRVKNLRCVSHQCNIRNSSQRIDNSSGVTGVRFDTKERKWVSRISVDRVQKHLGYFECFLEAVYHRLAAEQCLDWHRCSSTSSAYKYLFVG